MLGAIVVEYHRGGDLLGAEAVKSIFKDLAGALAYCHFGIRTPNDPLPNWDAIIHKDMKLENVFLRPSAAAPGGLVSILGDFGWATNERAEHALLRRPRGAPRSPGDPNWLPPEAPRITEKSDVWGLAAVVACACQRAVVPRALRRAAADGKYVVADVYGGRRLGAILEAMARVDVGRRWDSRVVLREVEAGWG
ncbi:hypothetical protein SLS58_004009 [Diplodia intermedia]|uniref:non-specific serine/threonine protein kinase n=1 Tax=Diplodia intermedia TaxID=856260 RepID=A0ABR3TUJ8_9PEZI